jgi:hypothetical protein
VFQTACLSFFCLAVLLSGCGEVISSLPDPNGGAGDGGSPLLAPALQLFTIDGIRTGDLLLSPNNSQDSIQIDTLTVGATRATLEVRLARLLPSGALAPEVRCDVLPLTLSDVGNASEQTFIWRVTGLPNGVYRFRVQVSDDAGNNSQSQSNVSLVRIGFASNTPCPLSP